MTRRLLTTRELAARLGYSPDHFRRDVLPRLMANGFPPPVAGTTRRDPAAVDRWLDDQLPRDTVELHVDWDREVERRITNIANGVSPL